MKYQLPSRPTDEVSETARKLVESNKVPAPNIDPSHKWWLSETYLSKETLEALRVRK